MDYKELLDKILLKAKDRLEDAEVLFTSNERLSIQSFKGEIIKHEIAETGGISLRGIYEGRMGYSYTERLDESVIDELIENVISNSLYLEGDRERIYPRQDDYKEFEKAYLDIDRLAIGDKISKVLELEKEVVSQDARVYEAMVGYSEGVGRTILKNTKGIDLENSSSLAILSVSSYVREGEETKTGSAYRILFDYDDMLDHKELAKEAVEDAVNKLGAGPVRSQNYKIMIENKTFSSLLASFVSVFSAESVQKDLSLLKGKIGEQVGASQLNIIDNPFMEKGIGSTSFDMEGINTQYKEIIKDGVLRTYLHNGKTAEKDGLRSTGNGFRGIKGSLGVGPTNLYVEKGNLSKEELMEKVGEGLLINSLQGLHSGLNPVSGDFSLSAEGFEIRAGKKARPVNQITIAGNFFDILKDIEYIGSDLEFAGSSIGSPSIVIKSLAVAGQ